ncbi:MAG: hypothetical protein ACJA0Q_000729 [Saprospiraceae bacterium]|jgi:hypothetical protein
MRYCQVWLLFFFLSSSVVTGQVNDSTKISNQINSAALIGVSSGGVALYGGIMLGLSTVWYKDYNQVGFHFTNDNNHWLQIDKFGHAYSSYLFSKVGMEALKRTGLGSKKSAIWGGVYGFSFLTTIEIIDAHYSYWGFSTGDVIANAVGPLLLVGQQMLFDDQHLSFKYSFHPTRFSDLRPGVFGGNMFNQLVADYNGQTYWLSLSLGSIIPKKKYLPKWLCVSAGYGAYGLLSSEANPTFNNLGNRYPEFQRTRSYYMSLDIDFDKIKTKSKVLRAIFSFLNLVKVPFPTFEINGNGKAIFHPLYF